MLTISANPLLNPTRISVAGVESDLKRLPHLNGDRRHVAKEAKRRYQDARQAQDAIAAISRLPDPDEAIHLAISGRFALWDLVPAVLTLAGCNIAELRIATLGFSKRNIDSLCQLLDSGKIGKAALLCSHYFKGTSGDIYEHAVTELSARGAAFISLRQHAKLLLMQLTDGRTVSVESSANLRSCKNIETMTLIGDPGVYRFHAGWIDELFAAGTGTKDGASK
jgi:hypothetical protein